MFASQRGDGQDLATHLSNEHDNEIAKVIDHRGTLGTDLHANFAVWNAQAVALTNLKKEFYHISLNPDKSQGTFEPEECFQFLNRIETSLGLLKQPRVVVVHFKNDREHYHAVYSRVDVANEKAVHLAFDHEKLMKVTRQFARDHDLKLPDGYYKGKGQHHENEYKSKGQLSLYEKTQQDLTGLSKEDRKLLITSLWQQSDSAKAFVAGLEENGYLLCTGRRSYILIDQYAQMNALPKMIDDRTVRSKDIVAFLEKDFPTDNLPDVEEAKSLIKEHLKQQKEFQDKDALAEKKDALKTQQALRREKLTLENTQLLDNHQRRNKRLSVEQFTARSTMRVEYLTEKKNLQDLRNAKRSTSPFVMMMAKASGFSTIQDKYRRRQDRKRYDNFALERDKLRSFQDEKNREQAFQHRLQNIEMKRRMASLDKVETREIKNLSTKETQQFFRQGRRAHAHMPAFKLELSPPGRKAMIGKAVIRHTSPLRINLNKQARGNSPPYKENLTGVFNRHAMTRNSTSKTDENHLKQGMIKNTIQREMGKDNDGRTQ